VIKVQNLSKNRTVFGFTWKDFERDTIYYVPAVILPNVAVFVGIWAFTRLLTPYEYGRYMLVMATVGLGSATVYGWINASAFRFVSEASRDHFMAGFFSTALGLYILVSTSLVIAAVPLYFAFKQTLLKGISFELYFLTLGLLVLSSFFSMLQGILRGQRMTGNYTLLTVTNAWLKICLGIILLVVLTKKTEIVILAYLVSLISISTVFLVMMLRQVAVSIRKLSVDLCKSFANYGFPLVGISAATWVLSLSDRYLLEYFEGSATVGLYSAGYQIGSQLILIPSSILMLAVFPISVQLYDTGNVEKLRRFLENSVRIFLFLLLPIFIPAVFLSELIVNLLGDQFVEAKQLIPIVLLGHLFLALSQYFHKGFELTKKTVNMFKYLLIAACCNVSLNLVLIPHMGSMGAAWATAISYFIYCIMLWTKSRHFFAWDFPFDTLLKGLGAISIGMFPAIVVWFVSQSVILTVALLLMGFIIYAFLLNWFKEKTACYLRRIITERMIL
jgi:O-antigen/teichoic acid export membrane protein